MEPIKYRMSRNMTTGQWLERTIYDLKYPSRLKPTSNWRCYVTLLHHLQREGAIISIPISKVNDRTFKQLIKWIKKAKNTNFVGIMRTFSALINKARRARLTRYKADFPFRDYAPKTTVTAKASDILRKGGSVQSLTKEQWNAFLEMDLSGIGADGPQAVFRKALYRDFCVLLYLLKSRPIDVLRLHSDNIAMDKSSGRTLCSYIPAKKINQNSVVVQFLSDEALKIVKKYEGFSRGGYLIPFKMNHQKWRLGNADEFNEHYKQAQNQLGAIDRFLHKVGEAMSLPFPLTLYAIRRSALTHAIIENRIPLPALAKMAGTSVRMIEKHYTNYMHTLAIY